MLYLFWKPGSMVIGTLLLFPLKMKKTNLRGEKNAYGKIFSFHPGFYFENYSELFVFLGEGAG